MVICSSQETNCTGQNIKEPCYLCKRSLNTWIKTSIHLDGSEKPVMLCYNCAKGVIKDVDQDSTEPETIELLQDVREYHDIYNQHGTVELICACENVISTFEK